MRRLASVLGAHVLVEEGEPMIDVDHAASRSERGTTYILMGDAAAAQRLAAPDASPSLLFQILRALPGRRPADRRRSHAAPERGRAMTALVVDPRRSRSSPLLGALRAARARPARSPRLPTASPSADPVPLHRARRSRSAASTRRCGSPASRARRSCRCSSRRCRCTSRSTRRCRASATARCRCSRRSSSAPRAPASRSTRGSSAGRTFRHAIRQLVEHETVRHVVVDRRRRRLAGLLPDDISWLLEHVPGEIIVIRPGPTSTQVLSSVRPGSRPKSRQSRATRGSGTRPDDPPPRFRFRASVARNGRT